MNDVVIDVQNVTKAYKLYDSNKQRILEGLFPFIKERHTDFYALRDVSFQVRKGELVGIIGKNGSGKSTILKIITGVLEPTGGSVAVNGRISALLELGSGFNPEYTGIENIYMNGTLMGVTREEMETRVQGIIDFADIGEFVHQPVKNYSSGMFVRLAFAVAINVEPDILIVDEALAVGDVAFQAKCMARMNQLMKMGTTILFVTHDMNTVKRLCQRCIYLENGVKIMEGPAEEIADIYLHRMRESMNVANSDTEATKVNKRIDVLEENQIENTLSEDKEFTKRVARFREGTGDVRVIRFDVVDENNMSIRAAEYNQKVRLRIGIEFYKDLAVGVGYHIRDDKNMELLGSNMFMERKALLEGKKGDKYIVEFETRLPLVEGAYNVQLVISEPIIVSRTARFVDLVENAAVFEVGENPVSKLWDKVYIKNELRVIKC